MLQNISNKYCLFDFLFIKESLKNVSTTVFISNNFSSAANQYIRITSEGSNDTEE